MTTKLPGPSLLEQIKLTRMLNSEPHKALMGLYEKYGPVGQFGFGKFKYAWTFGAEANEYVLHTNAANFTWKEAFWPLVAIDGDTALVVSDGDDHKRRKAIVLPAFHRKRISSYFDVMIAETDDRLAQWKPGSTIDAYAEMRFAVRRIALRCLFGEAFSDEREQEFVDHLEVPREYVNRNPVRRIDNAWLSPAYRKAMKHRRAMDVMVFNEISRRRASDEIGDDIMGWLIEAQEDGGKLTDQEVRDQVISLIAAAYDTTASTIGWVAVKLAEDADLRHQVRGEVSAATGGAALTLEHLPQLKLATGIVNEILRILPPAVLSVRKATNDFTLHGHTIPGGILVAYSGYVSGLDTNDFPDPHAFKPTRWIEGHPDYHPHHPYAYVPFGGGGRRCIGFAFALQELVVFTARLAALDFTPAYATIPKPEGAVSMAPGGGVPVRLAG
jgi:cytochrome P450